MARTILKFSGVYLVCGLLTGHIMKRDKILYDKKQIAKIRNKCCICGYEEEL